MSNDPKNFDPYASCEKTCYHDLAQGNTLADMLSGDGPHVDYADAWMTGDNLSPVASTMRAFMAS